MNKMPDLHNLFIFLYVELKGSLFSEAICSTVFAEYIVDVIILYVIVSATSLNNSSELSSSYLTIID